MGDRGNIVVLQKGYRTEEIRGMYLYSHWGGSDLAGVLDKAFAGGGRNRIGDQEYLTRIIFSHLTQGEVSETGYGISLFAAPDNEHSMLVVEAWTGDVYSIPETLTIDAVISSYEHGRLEFSAGQRV